MTPRARLRITTLEDRTTPAGLDPTFGTGGILTINNSTFDAVAGSVTQPDGRILVLLASDTTAASEPTTAELIRLLPNGSTDASFDGDGRQTVPLRAGQGNLAYPSSGTALGVLADGRIVIATSRVNYENPRVLNSSIPSPVGPSSQIDVVRLMSDGSPDPRFGINGHATYTTANDAQFYPSVVVLPDGAVAFAGQQSIDYSLVGDATRVFPSAKVRLFKLDATGKPAADFGNNGSALLDVGPGNPGDIRVAAVATGQLLVYGQTASNAPLPLAAIGAPAPSIYPSYATTAFAARVRADGALDATYGDKGVYRSTPDAAADFRGGSVDADGGLVLSLQRPDVYAATAPIAAGATSVPYLVRIAPNGQLDTGYAGDGQLELTSPHFQFGDVNGTFASVGNLIPLAIPGGGDYVLGARNDGVFVQRFTAGGTLDATFGMGGIAFLAFPKRDAVLNSYVNLATATVAADGDLLLTGTRSEGYGFPIPLAGSTTSDGATPPGSRPDDASGRVPPVSSFGNDLLLVRADVAQPTAPLPPEPKPEVPPPPPPPPIPGDPGRVCTGDIDGDGTLETITAPAPGSKFITVTNAQGVVVRTIQPYEDSFTGGLWVASADLNGDGKDELIVAPDVGGGARIQVLDVSGTATVVMDNFFAIDDAAFRGGARIAVGDLNGDGKADLIVGAGVGGGPRVAVYDGLGLLRNGGAPRKLTGDFFAFPGADAARLRDGVTLAAGDFNGDGKAELVVGAGNGGAPRVLILNGDLIARGDILKAQADPLANFFADGDDTSRGGADVAVLNDSAGSPSVAILNRTTGGKSAFSFPHAV